MHQSAMFYADRFFSVYARDKRATLKIVEIGSQNVNGSLREVSPPEAQYIGLDFVDGEGVDMVIDDPYRLPLEDGTADIVVSSSCFEHSEFFWLLFLEAMRVLKEDGLFYLNAPSNGFFHRWPVDCWRFYPDSGHAMVKWGERNGYTPLLLESFIGQRSAGRVSEGGMWNDFVAVFVKDLRYAADYPDRIVHDLTDFSNGYSSDRAGILNHNERGPDFELIENQLDQIDQLGAEVEASEQRMLEVTGIVSDRDRQISLLNQVVSERDRHITDLNRSLAECSAQVAERNRISTEMFRSLAECSAQVAELKQASTDKSRRISELDRVIGEYDQRIGSIQRERNKAMERLHQMERSRSWRMTAPYRALGGTIKSVFRSRSGGRPVLRLTVAFLLLPASMVFYGGLPGLVRAFRAGRGTFAQVIAGSETVRSRLLGRNRFLRRFVFFCFSLAVRIQRGGSLRRSLGNIRRILQTEGIGGLRRRVLVTVPGHTGAPGSADATPASELPELRQDIARRVLVADYRIPRPDVSAGELATVGILRDLCVLGYEVVFLPNNMAPAPEYAARLRELGVQVVTADSGYDRSAVYLERNGAGFGLFYLMRVDVAETLLPVARQVAPGARVIFHAPDLYFLREMRAAEIRKDASALEHAVQTRDRELAMMGRSDRVVVVSPAEVPVLSEFLPHTPISVFPVLYAPVIANPRPYAERRHIFFLGGFGHSPNVDAVQWFAAEVWPHVHRALPGVEFHIVGAEAPDSVLALGDSAGIRVVGFVPELEPVLSSMRVGVAPLRYGAGIKGKVAVTMGGGVPCVCTSIAAEGMGIRDGVHALVADEPESFARAVVALYQDERQWKRLSANGQTLVRDKFGDLANRGSLLRVLDQTQALPLAAYCNYCKEADPLPVPDPEDNAPIDVSIIVPVYNQWPFTRACLTSVVQTSMGGDLTYEVILADDGSSDETIHAVRHFPGLRIVRTPENLGFLRNCNNAAKSARGQHILLLNNDTVVLPNWLAALYRTMEVDPSIAIVGSKMLYPDGLIQEAGGALFNDGTALNVGRGSGRRTPVFNLTREVDYISGASILIRKSFWDAVGGFDERYRNAYCEDSDLAMTARARGMRVVYEPASEIIHFEHMSYAEQAPSHNAGLQKHNIALLKEKWHEVFDADHLAPTDWPRAAARAERSAPPAARSRRAAGKLNVLYFSPFPSHPASHGNRSTILQFGRFFKALGHKAHFVLLQSHEYTADDLVTMKQAWDSVDVVPFTNPMVADGREIPFDGWYEEGLGENIRLLCAKYAIDVVFCSYVFQSKLLDYVPEYMLKVIDTHDKMGGRYDMLRQNGQPLEFFSCSPEEEGRYLRRADLVVARRQEEADYFNSVSGRDSAIVIPHVEDPHFVDRPFDALRKVGLVASANRINLAIVRECLEAIERGLTGGGAPFTIHVAGQVKAMAEALPERERAVFRRPWVRLRGFVPDISEFYKEMDLILSPVTMGTGINVKTVQAMAHGMPLLTTAWGSKGIETDDPMHRLPDLDALAGALIGLANTPRELARLAEVSRMRYLRFFEDSREGMRRLFSHPKLRAGTGSMPTRSEFLPVVMAHQSDRVSAKVLQERAQTERTWQARLDSPKSVGEIEAECCVCGPKALTYSFDYGWKDPATGAPVVNWREQLVCPSCGLNARMRSIVQVVTGYLRLRPDSRVYITEQTTDLYRLLRERAFARLVGSEFLGPDCTPGTIVNGVRHEDMTQLSFADASRDAVLSFDVLEHIPGYEMALKEVFRCLAPGGRFVLTAPFDPTAAETLVRADVLDNGEIRHRLPPEYHGDPVNPEAGILCFQTFGWDLLEKLRSIGFIDVSGLDCWSLEYGYLGEVIVLVATKPVAELQSSPDSVNGG